MIAPRRMGYVVVVCCCVAVLTVAPVAAAAQGPPPRIQNATSSDTNSNGQPVTTCFSGSGTEFIVGSENSTRIWIRLHATVLTGSGGSIGAELAGSTTENSIIEVVAGLEYVGGGFLDLLTSPTDSFAVVKGFDFQLPMLNGVSTGLGADESAGSENDQSTTDEQSAADETGADDSPFEMLRC